MNDISRWVQAEVDLSLAQTIAQAIEIPKLIAKLLILRGINTPDEALDFIEPKLANLNDPAKFMDMDTATARIVKAVQKKPLLCVFGDYDADGLTATTILADFLEASGADVTTFIPDRMTEGYGLQPDRVRSLAQLGIKLIITVDCGIRAHEAVQVASKLGVDVIIVDHHVPDPTLQRRSPSLIHTELTVLSLCGSLCGRPRLLSDWFASPRILPAWHHQRCGFKAF